MPILEENLFISFSNIDKTYRRLCLEAVQDLDDFTRSEALVLAFLTNADNKPLDTATDIAQWRNTSKGLVAKSVESLTDRGYLTARRDEEDRRVVHLCPTGLCTEAAKRLDALRKSFNSRISNGINTEERAAIKKALVLMAKNLEQITEEEEACKKEPNKQKK